MKAIPSFLLGLSLIAITPNAIAQTVRSDDFNSLANRNSQDLMGVQPRSIEDWPWAVGGKYPEPQESEPLDSTALNLDYYEARIESLNESYELNDTQLGDVSRPTRRLPFAQF
ncbi:MAG TPA: hypothetical protein DCF68_01370 [Cyanothece sp. UBA12306]|nr:hypothetical protein [Cyanothece sp. UBA12306]